MMEELCGALLQYKPLSGDVHYYACHLPKGHAGCHQAGKEKLTWPNTPPPTQVVEYSEVDVRAANIWEKPAALVVDNPLQRVQAEKDAIRLDLLQEVFTEMYDMREVRDRSPGADEEDVAPDAYNDVLDLLDQRIQFIVDRWGS
jgi:hypothetical protein